MRALPFLFLLACSAPPARLPRPAPVPPIPLAITIDDLPFHGSVEGSRTDAIARIVAAAQRHRAPVTGFVTCNNIRADGELERWMAPGVTLANHTTSHRSIDALGAAAFRADIERCQARIERTNGRAPTFFRYPFLQTGATQALRDEGFQMLRELSLRRAPVTIDTADWLLARAYVSDPANREAIVEAYLAHVRAAVRRYLDRAAREGHPRSAQILLIHANALSADHLDDLLTMLESLGFQFVSLESALRDPLYAREDGYAGRIGMSWLYRIRPGAENGWKWDAAQMHAIDVRFGGARERPSFDLDEELHLRRVAHDTWILTDNEPWPANSLLARMPDGSLVLVSTPYTDEAARSLLDFLNARFGDVPLTVINPHFHPDGVGANRAFLAAGARVVGSEHTARLVRERSSAIRTLLADALRDRPDMATRFADYDPAPPRERFDPSRPFTLRFGEESVQIVFVGAAHSPDNVVIYFPRRRILYGGCMILAGDRIGNTSDADLRAWPSAIERLRAFDAALIVPGHGDRTDPGLLDHTLELLSGG